MTSFVGLSLSTLRTPKSTTVLYTVLKRGTVVRTVLYSSQEDSRSVQNFLAADRRSNVIA